MELKQNMLFHIIFTFLETEKLYRAMLNQGAVLVNPTLSNGIRI